MTVRNVFILASKKFLQAGYIRENKIEAISIDGNQKITYSSDNDFNRLIEAIKDTFNIDELDEAELSITVISCGASISTTDHVFELIKKAKQHYLINAETVIPFICACKGILNNKQDQTISLLDSVYQIIKHQDEHSFCCQLDEDTSKEVEHALELSDCTCLVNFDISKFSDNEKAIEQYKNTIDAMKTEITKVNSDCENHLNRIKQLEQDVLSYKNRYEDFVLKYQSILVSSRMILRFNIDLPSFESENNRHFVYESYQSFCQTRKISKFKLLKENLQTVSVGDDLISFKLKGELEENILLPIFSGFSEQRSNNYSYTLKSPFAGKLFLRDHIENYFEENCIIGCICHPADDENLVKLWLETQPRS